MNHKFIPAVAAFLILGMLLAAIPLSVAQIYAIGPQLDVVTIPQDNQELSTGIIILGIAPFYAPFPIYVAPFPTKLMAQYKLIITYNGQTLDWQIGTPGPSVTCNVFEKDKVNVVPDPKTGLGQQFTGENLMTKLADVSKNFACKIRWKSPATGVYESVGVLDVYWTGPLPAAQTVVNGKLTGGVSVQSMAYWIADNILTVEAFFAAGRTTVFGSDIQDICTLGWGVTPGPSPGPDLFPVFSLTLPDGTTQYVWQDAMGSMLSCEALALYERAILGLPLAQGQD
ncbi:MAG TPA: hypothetical protein VED24_00515 [Candidatus Acidoferrum sp.]|nr:hypothetical protein [Candidatus Acidoferrum sp.]